MAAELATKLESNPPMLTAFAQEQMSDWIRQRIDESTFLELAVCAFLCGAEQQFRKLSKQYIRDSYACLIDVVMDIGNISESKTIALLNAIKRLAGKYYLIENIIEQGKTAADQWLNCQGDDAKSLQALVAKYQNLSMFDLCIEGINEEYDQQQQDLYDSVDQSVGRLRRRALVTLLIIGGMMISAGISLLYL